MKALPINRAITVEDVALRVEQIRREAGDDEAAHSSEDMLHQSVLRAIAEGRATDPSLCAAAALSTREIKFSRWCA